VLWRQVITDMAASSHGQRLTFMLAGWSPWILMALGLICSVPVAVQRWRDRDGRFYSNGSNAWAGWGVTLYILGFGLAAQVGQIHSLHSS
jgi:hypothetical protein